MNELTTLQLYTVCWKLDARPLCSYRSVSVISDMNLLCMLTGIKLLRMYTDPAEDECFYSLSWSYHDKDTPVIAVAGKRAVIRIIYPTSLGFSSDELVSLKQKQNLINLTFY